MPDPKAAPQRRIRPAGWVVILLGLGAIGYGAYRLVEPHLGELRAYVPHDMPDAGPPDAGSHLDAGPHLDAGHPAPVHDAGPQDAGLAEEDAGATTAIARPELTPSLFPHGVTPAAPAGKPLRLAFPALAAMPEAVAHGVKAVWYLGAWRSEGDVTPPCAVNAAPHVKASEIERPAVLFHRLALVAEYQSQHTHDIDAGTAPCPYDTLPDAAFAFVIVAKPDRRALSAGDITGVLAMVDGAHPSKEDVAAYFDPDHATAGNFKQIFESAGQVWLSVGAIDKPVASVRAFDGSLVGIKQAAPPPPPPPPPAAKPATAPIEPLGYPSWLDRSR